MRPKAYYFALIDSNSLSQQVNAITWLTSDCLLHAFLSVSKLLDRCKRSCYELQLQLWTIAVVVDSVTARRTESLSGLHGLTLS